MVVNFIALGLCLSVATEPIADLAHLDPLSGPLHFWSCDPCGMAAGRAIQGPLR